MLGYSLCPTYREDYHQAQLFAGPKQNSSGSLALLFNSFRRRNVLQNASTDAKLLLVLKSNWMITAINRNFSFQNKLHITVVTCRCCPDCRRQMLNCANGWLPTNHDDPSLVYLNTLTESLGLVIITKSIEGHR